MKLDRVKELMAARYLAKNPANMSQRARRMRKVLTNSIRQAQDILRQVKELNELGNRHKQNK